MIVRKRRDFEYLIRSRSPRKVDFLRYLEFEVNLESLRRKRKKRLGLRKPVSCDHAIVQHAHFIFDRALRKFRGDVNFWLQWIDFSQRAGSSKRLADIFPRALRLLPRSETLWLRAAGWAFDGEQSMGQARMFLQRGLRLNPSSQVLWQQYFRLELLHVMKLRARRALLGVAPGASHEAVLESLEMHGSGDADEALLSSQDSSDAEAAEDSEAERAKRRFFAGAVPQLIFHHAVQSIPHDISFRFGFLSIAQSFREGVAGEEGEEEEEAGCDPTDRTLQRLLPRPEAFPAVTAAILQSIAESFPQHPCTWDGMAMHAVSRINAGVLERLRRRIDATERDKGIRLDENNRQTTSGDESELAFHVDTEGDLSLKQMLHDEEQKEENDVDDADDVVEEEGSDRTGSGAKQQKKRPREASRDDGSRNSKRQRIGIEPGLSSWIALLDSPQTIARDDGLPGDAILGRHTSVYAPHVSSVYQMSHLLRWAARETTASRLLQEADWWDTGDDEMHAAAFPTEDDAGSRPSGDDNEEETLSSVRAVRAWHAVLRRLESAEVASGLQGRLRQCPDGLLGDALRAVVETHGTIAGDESEWAVALQSAALAGSRPSQQRKRARPRGRSRSESQTEVPVTSPAHADATDERLLRELQQNESEQVDILASALEVAGSLRDAARSTATAVTGASAARPIVAGWQISMVEVTIRILLWQAALPLAPSEAQLRRATTLLCAALRLLCAVRSALRNALPRSLALVGAGLCTWAGDASKARAWLEEAKEAAGASDPWLVAGIVELDRLDVHQQLQRDQSMTWWNVVRRNLGDVLEEEGKEGDGRSLLRADPSAVSFKPPKKRRTQNAADGDGRRHAAQVLESALRSTPPSRSLPIWLQWVDLHHPGDDEDGDGSVSEEVRKWASFCRSGVRVAEPERRQLPLWNAFVHVLERARAHPGAVDLLQLRWCRLAFQDGGRPLLRSVYASVDRSGWGPRTAAWVLRTEAEALPEDQPKAHWNLMSRIWHSVLKDGSPLCEGAPNMWLAFIQWCRATRAWAEATAAYERAIRSLDDDTEFVEAHAKLVAGAV